MEQCGLCREEGLVEASPFDGTLVAGLVLSPYQGLCVILPCERGSPM